MLYDIQIERDLIASIVVSPPRLAQAQLDLIDDDFYDNFAREMFTSLRKLSEKSDSLDWVGLHAVLTERNTYTKYQSEFAECLKAFGSPNVKLLIEAVKSLSIKRATHNHVRQMQISLESEEISTSEIVSSLNNHVELITNINSDKTYTFKDDTLESLVDKNSYVSTGFPMIDLAIGGFAKSEYSLLGARTHVAKTMLSLDFSISIAKTDEVVFYTLEDSAKQIKYKILAKLAGIHSDIIKTGHYNDLEKQRIENCIDKAKKLKFEVVDGLTDINDITADINHKMLKKYRRFIVIDYAQKLQDREIKGYSKHETITSASDKIHKACIKYNTHIMCPAQFGRDVEKTREEPMLSDFKECGSLEQDGMLIFLAWIKEKDGKDIVLKCAKNKTSGKYFKIDLSWNKSTFSFQDHQVLLNDDKLYRGALK